MVILNPTRDAIASNPLTAGFITAGSLGFARRNSGPNVMTFRSRKGNLAFGSMKYVVGLEL
jgi:hypothetical protein